MADYHPLITRAVSGLEKDTAENRRVLYERARTALVVQLRGTVPALDEPEITRERLALEEAIRKVEVESARRAREAPKSEPATAKRAAEAARRAEAERAEQAARREEAEQAEQAAEAARREEAERAKREAHAALAARSSREDTPTIAPEPAASESARVKQTAPDAAPGALWPQSEPGALLDEALKEFREVARSSSTQSKVVRPAQPARPAFLAPVPLPSPATPPMPQPFVMPPSGQTPPLQPAPPLLDALKELESFEPRLSHEDWRTPPAEQVWPMQNFASGDLSPAIAPQQTIRAAEERVQPPRSLRSYRWLIWILIGLVVVAGGTALGYWQGSAIMQAARSIVAPLRGSTTQAQRDTTPSRTKIPDRIGQPDSSPSPKSATTIAPRAMLTTEPDANNPRGRDYVGSATWRTETIPAGSGRAAEVAIKLEVEIPDRGFAMTWLIRRNTDPTLPASHTIDIEFNLAPNSSLGRILEIKSLLMKQPGQVEGSPLWGHAQRSTPNYFLVGLSAVEADAQYNLQLLKGQPAFDVALVFSNVRRAFLLVEKGSAGERVFAEAFAAWKQ